MKPSAPTPKRPIFLCRLLVRLLVSGFAPALLAAPASPTSGFVTANGVRLHYLDWGGSGPSLLLLGGFRDNAHVFDSFAPRFTDRFHVLGLTRRGFGESEKPSSGYDTSTRVEDIAKFLDTRGISQVILVGHSLAGDELTLFASRYPKRVRKLVYLDALYDRSPAGWKDVLTDPVAPPAWLRRAKMEALGEPGASRIAVPEMPPREQWAVWVAIQRAMFEFRPDYRKIQAPALVFTAITANEHYPRHWLPNDASAELRARAEKWWQEKGRAFARRGIEQFRRQIPDGKVIELRDAQHYIFLGPTQDEVVKETREFLLP